MSQVGNHENMHPENEGENHKQQTRPCHEFKYFLQLPAELRIRIYDLALELPQEIEAQDYRARTTIRAWSLLFVNKQISIEAAHRLYSKSTVFLRSAWPDTISCHVDVDDSKVLEWMYQIGNNANSITSIEYWIYTDVEEEWRLSAQELSEILSLVPSLRNLTIQFCYIQENAPNTVVEMLQEVIRKGFTGEKWLIISPRGEEFTGDGSEATAKEQEISPTTTSET